MSHETKIFIKFLIALGLIIAGLMFFSTAHAQAPSFWYPNDNNELQPVDDVFGLKIPSIDQGCLEADGDGVISSTGVSCGSGGGGNLDGQGIAGMLAVWSDTFTLGVSNIINVGSLNATNTNATSTFSGGLSSLLYNVFGPSLFSGAVTHNASTTFAVPPSSNQAAYADDQLIRKGEFDAAIAAALAGQTYKVAADVSTTGNVNLANGLENGDTQDGVTLVTGMRVLVHLQSAQAENGVYIVPVSGAASRATDLDTTAELDSGATITVTMGTTYGNTLWIQVTDNPTIGVDPIVWNQLPAPDPIQAGDALERVGDIFNVLFDDVTIGLTSNMLQVKDLAITGAKLAVGAVDLAGSKITGILGLTNGGTGASTAQGARTNLLPSQSGQSGKFLSTNGTDVLWAEAGSGGSVATTSFGATVIPYPLISSASLNQSMGAAPSGDQEFGSTVSASSTISRRPYDMSRVDSFWLTADQRSAGATGQTMRLQCSTDGTVWYDAGGSAATLSIQATGNLKESNPATLNTACRTKVILRLMGNGGNGTANPAFRSITAQFRLTQPAAGETATSSLPMNFISTFTAQAFSNMVAATTTYAYQPFDTTNATRYRLGKNQTVLASTATNARVWLECSQNGTTFVEATTDSGRYLSIFAAGTTTTDWLTLRPTCVGNVDYRLQGAGGVGAASDPAFTYLGAQFDTTEQVIGDTNWIDGVSDAIYYLLGNVGIGTTTPSAKLAVDGNVIFQGDEFATTTIGDMNTFVTIGRSILDGIGIADLKIPVLFGKVLSSTLGQLDILGIYNELLILSPIGSDPKLSFADLDFGNGSSAGTLLFSIADAVFNFNSSLELQAPNGDTSVSLSLFTSDRATSTSIQLTEDDSLFFLGADGGNYFNSSVAILSDDDNGFLVLANPLGDILSAIGFSTSTDQQQFIQASGGYYFDNNIGIGSSAFAPKSRLHITDGDVWIVSSTRGLIQTSPDGTCWRQTISNLGVASWSSITCPN